MDNPIKMDDLGVHHFRKPPCNLYTATENGWWRKTILSFLEAKGLFSGAHSSFRESNLYYLYIVHSHRVHVTRISYVLYKHLRASTKLCTLSKKQSFTILGRRFATPPTWHPKCSLQSTDTPPNTKMTPDMGAPCKRRFRLETYHV